VRLDTRQQVAGMCLITVPIDSHIGLKTESAHGVNMAGTKSA